MSQTVTQRVTVERDGAVLLIGINRPEKRNAFDLETIEAFSAAGVARRPPRVRGRLGLRI